MAFSKKKVDAGELVVKAPEIRMLRLPILGVTPLVTNPMSEKFKNWMHSRAEGNKEKLVPSKPEEAYEATIYTDSEGRHYFPASGVKKAIVYAAGFINGIAKCHLNVVVYVRRQNPEGGVIIYGEPQMRTDIVRLDGPSRTPDIRFRAEYVKWGSILEIEYDSDFISEQNVVNLVAHSGRCGIGEMRPSKSGMEYGQYRPASIEEFNKYLNLKLR